MFALLLSLWVAAVVAAPGVQHKSINNNEIIDTRIIGGSSAEDQQFPYQVTFQYSPIPGVYRHFCGGSIISPRHILTAGHCLNNLPPGLNIIVKAGKLLLDTVELSEQTRNIAKVQIHEKYGGNIGPYDIAIVTLDKPFRLNANVKMIALPKIDSEHTGDVILSGWGSISPLRIEIPNNLQYTKLPLLSYETCKSAMLKFSHVNMVDNKNICTGPLSGGHAACSGDSGGPLVQKNEKGTNILIGIVSWGHVPCGTLGAPSVYTKVSVFRDWIDEIITQ